MEHYKKTIKENILKKIEENKLNMRPRAYFVMRMVLIAAVALLILLVSTFLFNFIFFSARISGHLHLVRSGASGTLVFLKLFPWHLLITDLLLIALLEYLLRKFRFAYRHPALYIFLILLGLAIAFGFLIDNRFDVNDRLLRHADNHELPGPFNSFYEGARRMPPRDFRY